jgi:hypothetical protein
MIRPVTDFEVVQRAISQMRAIAESSYRIALASAKARRWIVVPVESGSHFDDNDAQTIAEACQLVRCGECLAVATESLEEKRLCYRIQMTKSGLLAFSHECGHFNYLVFPDNVSFAILCTVKDYYLVAGSTDFVTKAVGNNVEAARSEFVEFARNEFWTVSERENLTRIAEAYAACDSAGESKGDAAH